MAERILVVDDEETLCELLRFNLETEGYEVDTAHSAEEALTLDLQNYSLILLDIMMGDISGFQMALILKKKEATAGVPIIFCTARESEDDMVAGLNLGADDYIVKPYSIRNVIARVRTVLRRTSHQHGEAAKAPADMLEYKGLQIDTRQKICKVDGKEIKMPRKEFEILLTLLSHRGQVFTREELLHLIWPDEVIVLDRVIDVNITRLRSKLGVYGRNIVTRPGYGYGFFAD